MSAVRYLLVFVRLLLGAWMLLNGLNHFWSVFPQPLGRTEISGELMVSLIETGLFGLVKGTEIIVGICLLFDWFVPLALVLSMTISTVIWYNRMFLEGTGIDFSMGNGCFFFTAVLLVAYLPNYLTMLSWRAEMARPADLARLREIFVATPDHAPESRHRLLIAIAGIVTTLVVFWRMHPWNELPPGAGKIPTVVVREYMQKAYAEGRRAEAERLYFSPEAIAASATAAYPRDGQPMKDTVIDLVAQGHRVMVHHRIEDPQRPEPVDAVDLFVSDRAGIIIRRSAIASR